MKLRSRFLWLVAFGVVALGMILFVGGCSSPSKKPTETKGETTEMAASLAKENKLKLENRLDWFKEAKYGMFIHWGIYSVPASGEWYQYDAKLPATEYEKYAGEFNPIKFNAKEWVALAKAAGMKYIVITAKHHDGFCMFGTKLTPYNIVDATPYKRDPMKDLSEACREADIKLCFYYSVKDWHHPDYPINNTFPRKGYPEGFHGAPNPKADYLKYLDYVKGQLRELLTNYGPVGIIWFDFGVGLNEGVYKKKAQEIVDMIHELQPKCLINDRLDHYFGNGVGADYFTPENIIPAEGQNRYFETCMTLNGSWGYNINDHNWKDAKTVILNLVETVSKNGNFLLNVGPNAEGVIPDDASIVLRRTGQWIHENGETIYGTNKVVDSNVAPSLKFWNSGISMFITTKPGKWFLHMFDWPKDQKIFLGSVPHGIKKAYLFGDKNKTPLGITYYNGKNYMMLHLPSKAPDEIDSVIVIEFSN